MNSTNRLKHHKHVKKYFDICIDIYMYIDLGVDPSRAPAVSIFVMQSLKTLLLLWTWTFLGFKKNSMEMSLSPNPAWPPLNLAWHSKSIKSTRNSQVTCRRFLLAQCGCQAGVFGARFM